MTPLPTQRVGDVLDHALRQPPRLGRGRLVCIDGPAASGKSTLAAAVARDARDRLGPASRVVLIRSDDLLVGWSGLPRLAERLHDELVAPLAGGAPARLRWFDWMRDELGTERVVEPPDLLVLEGVGTADDSLAAYRATLVVVTYADREARLRRGVERDGEEMRAHWVRWQDEEEALLAREGAMLRADLIVDGGRPLV